MLVEETLATDDATGDDNFFDEFGLDYDAMAPDNTDDFVYDDDDDVDNSNNNNDLATVDALQEGGFYEDDDDDDDNDVDDEGDELLAQLEQVELSSFAADAQGFLFLFFFGSFLFIIFLFFQLNFRAFSL